MEALCQWLLWLQETRRPCLVMKITKLLLELPKIWNLFPRRKQFHMIFTPPKNVNLYKKISEHVLHLQNSVLLIFIVFNLLKQWNPALLGKQFLATKSKSNQYKSHYFMLGGSEICFGKSLEAKVLPWGPKKF